MNIYVGNIAFSMTDDELKQAFEAFGEVSRATILKDKMTNRSRGFGFCRNAKSGRRPKSSRSIEWQRNEWQGFEC